MTTSELVTIAPQPGPQEAFMASAADVAIFGGAAGSGKSFSVLLWIASLVDLPRYSAVVFRRTSTELTGGGSIWEESQTMFRNLGGTPRQNPNLDWRFPSGAIVEFRHLQHAWDVHGHQSKQYATIVFEELTQFEESQFWYLLSRARTKANVRAHIRATCNPDSDSFVRKLIDWWIGPDGLPIEERSGQLRWFIRIRDELRWYDTEADALAEFPGRKPLSLTFVSAKLEDNRLGDPSYRERLEALPFVERERLLGRNWNVRHSAGNVIRREWFRVVDAPPGPVGMTVRGWDKGATVGGDETVGIKLGMLGDGQGYVVLDVATVRGTPASVFALMRSCAEADGQAVPQCIWQDPGQAGIVDVDTTTQQLRPYAVRAERASSSKLEYARPWATAAEHGALGTGPPIYVVRGPWLDALLSEFDGFDGASGGKDNKVDAVSRAWLELHRPSGANMQSFRAVSRPRGGFH